MRITGGGDPVTHGNGDRVRPLGDAAGHDPGCGGVLVAGVFETAVGDQHDPAEICLVAIGLGAPVAADGAVSVGVGLVAAVGARPFHGPSGPRYGDAADLRQRCAAALTEPVGAPQRSAAHCGHAAC